MWIEVPTRELDQSSWSTAPPVGHQRWDRIMKWNEISNLVIGLGVISFGLHLLFYTEAYSLKQRMYVQFVSSPVKEIFGVACILWGLGLIGLVVRADLKKRKSKES
jgi:hypothetical protein